MYETQIFIGPKLQDEMKQVAPGLELTVDYGLLTVLAQPVFWLLKTIHWTGWQLGLGDRFGDDADQAGVLQAVGDQL